VTWWKRKKCPLCKKVLKPKNETADVRLDTLDGPLELNICMNCSTILDKSAEILNGKRRSKEKEETEEDNL
jgi:RNase P subunit RPR2